MSNEPKLEAGSDIASVVAQVAMILSGGVDEDEAGKGLDAALLQIEQLSCRNYGDAVCLLALATRILGDWSFKCERGYLTDGKEGAYIWSMQNKALQYLLDNPPLEPGKAVH